MTQKGIRTMKCKHFMRTRVVSTFTTCVLLVLLILPSNACAEKTMDWIRVDGNRFVNSSGETIIFRGVNIRDPHDLARDEHWSKAHFQEVKNWGANVVRLPIHPRAWRARGQQDYLKLIDQAVTWSRDLGLYLILDWHSIGNLKQEKFFHERYVTTLEETHAFWQMVSKRYAQEPVIAMYELFNEPTVHGGQLGEITWPEWKKMNEDMIQLIRKNHPQAIILVAGFNWGYDLTPIKEDPIQASGIAYVSHPYPEKRKAPWEPQWEKDWGYVANTYPVILTEIGFALPDEKGAHIPVNGDETYGQTLVDYSASKGISWVVWCFNPDWSPVMITDWNYTPSRQGAFFRKVMRGQQ